MLPLHLHSHILHQFCSKRCTTLRNVRFKNSRSHFPALPNVQFILRHRCGCVVGDVTFAEFAQYVVYEWSTGKVMNEHWRPQYLLCSPCYIDYDFIGRFGHLNDDAKHVLDKITASGGPGSNVTFPTSNALRDGVPLSQQFKNFYADLSHDMVRKLIDIYKHDYVLFDYDYHWACNDC